MDALFILASSEGMSAPLPCGLSSPRGGPGGMVRGAMGLKARPTSIKKHPSILALTLNFPQLSVIKIQGFSNLPVQLSHLTISTGWLKYFRPTPLNEKLVKTKWLVKKIKGGEKRGW